MPKRRFLQHQKKKRKPSFLNEQNLKGHPSGYNNLGRVYQSEELGKNFKLSKEMLSKAVELGDATACTNLAYFYLEDGGGLAEHLKWLFKKFQIGFFVKMSFTTENLE